MFPDDTKRIKKTAPLLLTVLFVVCNLVRHGRCRTSLLEMHTVAVGIGDSVIPVYARTFVHGIPTKSRAVQDQRLPWHGVLPFIKPTLRPSFVVFEAHV